jgi:hypothetical protein
MVKIVEMDENVTLKSQLEEDVGSVIVLNKFTVKPEEVDQFNQDLSPLSCTAVLVVVVHSLTMSFGNL